MREKRKYAEDKYFSRDSNEKNEYNIFLKRFIPFFWFHNFSWFQMTVLRTHEHITQLRSISEEMIEYHKSKEYHVFCLQNLHVFVLPVCVCRQRLFIVAYCIGISGIYRRVHKPVVQRWGQKTIWCYLIHMLILLFIVRKITSLHMCRWHEIFKLNILTILFYLANIFSLQGLLYQWKMILQFNFILISAILNFGMVFRIKLIRWPYMPYAGLLHNIV